MIQYSSINDAWGNKEIYKKNTLNNMDGFNNSKPVETFVSPKVTQELQKPQEIQEHEKPQVSNNIPQIIETSNKEHFEPMPLNNTHLQNLPNLQNSSCSFAEHLKNCEHCRNSLTEYFDTDSAVAHINIFGLKINITKDVLKVIFVILIVLIFIIILSTINISLNDQKMHMKYYIVPQVPHNFP